MRLQKNPLSHCLGACIAVAACAPMSALAQDSSDMFRFSGYGTVGVVHSSEDRADFATTNTPFGAGATDRFSTKPDSRLAFQVDATFTDKFSGVAQVVTEYTAKRNYDADVELALLKYAVTPSLAVRVGRMQAPIFMLSDYRKVGYAMPWVRPPVDVYSYAISVDGADATYKFSLGDTAMTLQAFAGRSDEHTFSLKRAAGANLRAEFGDSSVFASYNSGDLTTNNAALEALLGYYRPFFTALADQYQVKDDKVTFASVGYAYDPGSWFARSEFTRTSGDTNLLAKTTNLYLSGGVRIGKFTPYATYGRVIQDSATSIGSVDRIGVINSVLASGDQARESMTFGTRWDFRESFALKLEASYVDADRGSAGGLSNLQPGFVRGSSYNLLSASLDFVF